MTQAPGFEGSYFGELARLEAAHFWFRVRNRLIVWALREHGGTFRSFLEVGCGTGYVLSGVAEAFPRARLVGSERFAEGLRIAAARQPGVAFARCDATRIPFVDEFDVVGAFDVLEHVERDDVALAQMRDALTARGLLLLTVPQHAWLWSRADEYARHARRYSSADLRRKVEAAGFEILRSTSFVSLLLPALVASRWLDAFRRAPFDPLAEYRLPGWMNRVFEALLRAEIALIRSGLDLPAGGSRLMVARKR